MNGKGALMHHCVAALREGKGVTQEPQRRLALVRAARPYRPHGPKQPRKRPSNSSAAPQTLPTGLVNSHMTVTTMYSTGCVRQDKAQEAIGKTIMSWGPLCFPAVYVVSHMHA